MYILFLEKSLSRIENVLTVSSILNNFVSKTNLLKTYTNRTLNYIRLSPSQLTTNKESKDLTLTQLRHMTNGHCIIFR